jgi:thiosulfate/3-mercaptopyruvate sulfurtransferase
MEYEEWVTMTAYARPETLVSTEWVAERLDDPSVRIVEVDVDTSQYETGHVPGAVGWNWQTELQDPLVRDVVKKAPFADLLERAGIAKDTTVVLYGDNNNWFAAYAFWLLKYYGHKDVRLMNGGRKKWLEEGRDLVTAVPKYEATTYAVEEVREAFRAYKEDIFRVLEERNADLIDVRSPDEFTGKILAPPGLPETAQRGGHIPGAANVPWSKAVNDDGTFKSVEDLRGVYVDEAGVRGDREVIAYCRIGERSSHTWYVQRYLLGFDNVRNYDGSWTEWGNLVNAPVER